MIARLFALTCLLGLLAGSVWYLFRDTPQKKIQRWRTVSKWFFEHRGELGDEALEKAQEYNDRILRLFPRSAHDLLFKARLRLAAGTREAIQEALDIYDEILARGDPRTAAANLYKAMALRALGRFRESYGAALSVMDAHPYQAHVEMAETALAEYAPLRAAACFRKALERYAVTPVEKAAACEGLAEAYRLLADLAAPGEGTGPGDAHQEDPSEKRTDWAEEVRTSLDGGLDFLLMSEPGAEAEKQAIERQYHRLLLKRAALGEGAGARVVSGLKRFQVWHDAHHKKSWTEDPGLLALRGVLELRALEDEAQAIEDEDGIGGVSRWQDEARRHLEAALLETTASEAIPLYDTRTLSIEVPEDADGAVIPTYDEEARRRRRYVASLLTLTQGLVESRYASILLAAPEPRGPETFLSPLELHRRVADGMASPDEDVAQLFKLVTGLAHLRAASEASPAGAAPTGTRLLVEYLESIPRAERPRAALDLAEQVLRVAPQVRGENGPLAIELYDRFQATGGGPLELLGRRLELLARRRSSPLPEAEVSRRREAALDAARSAALTARGEEASLVTRVLLLASGVDEAVLHLRTLRDQGNPAKELTRELAELLLKKAAALAARGARQEALAAYREALAEHVRLFLANPAGSQDVIANTLEILRLFARENEDPLLEAALASIYPEARPGDRSRFSDLLRSFFAGRFDAALEKSRELENPGAFAPVLSFLQGSCHLGIARRLASQRPAAGAPGTPVPDALARAREAFREAPAFLASQIEALHLELLELPADQDVPGELLARLEELSSRPDVEHHGSWLLSRAQYHRFRYRFHSPSYKNSQVLRPLGKAQAALRSAIHRRPTFAPAYLALAETHVALAREDEVLQRRGSELVRRIAEPDYDKAAGVLEAVPSPNAEVTLQLARYLEEAGRPEDAQLHLEAVAFFEPSLPHVARLLESYLDTRAYADFRLVTGDPELSPEEMPRTDAEAPPHAIAVEKALSRLPELESTAILFYEDVLDRARHEERAPPLGVTPEEVAGCRRFRRRMLARTGRLLRSAPGGEALEQVFLAQLYLQLARETPGKAKRDEYHRTMMEHYEKALSAYESRGEQVPLGVLNNLAWYLVERDDPESLSRGLELARRARSRIDPEEHPDIADTYAWALYRNREYLGAQKEYRALLEKVPAPGYRYRLAVVLFELGSLKEAEEQLQLALRSPAFEDIADGKKLEEKIRRRKQEILGPTARK